MNDRRAYSMVWLLGLVAAATALGCAGKPSFNNRYAAPWRLSQGLVLILPGVEGESGANHDIRKGLDRGGVRYALVIYPWGFPVPGVGVVVNQTNVLGNRAAGKKLAEMIAEYQQNYPGRPVFMVGHSAGGGIAVFALESLAKMPDARPIDGAVLLSASLSAGYKLNKALTMVERGIVNFYDPTDTILLFAGTTLMGNVDGGRGASAGRTGFKGSYAKVHNQEVTAREAGVASLPHFVTAHQDLIARLLPPWITSRRWPPNGEPNGDSRSSMFNRDKRGRKRWRRQHKS